MICMKFQTFKIKFRGKAKFCKDGYFVIPIQEYYHYENQSIIVS